jgi:hypothetical protein
MLLKCEAFKNHTICNNFRPSIEFTALIKDDNFTEPQPVRSHSTLPRNRRRSQNYDNLSCAMSALSFPSDGRSNYNYQVRGNEVLIN